MKKKQIFWGSGKTGREVLSLWKKLNMRPDYFCDNGQSLWGSETEGVKILAPQEVYDWKNQVTVFITCGRYEEVRAQLLGNGIPETEIVRADDTRTPEMLCRMSGILSRCVSPASPAGEERYKCLVDLSGGMVLGGVERWSYSFAGTLNALNIRSAYILPSFCERKTADSTIPAEFVEHRKGVEITDTMEKILQSGAETVVCSFPFEIMAGACIIKKHINPGLRVIAVLHNDEEIYYRALKTWEPYIDVCLTISTRIKNALWETGFPRRKTKELYWKIPCNKESRHSYSPAGCPLNIGYAGRISVRQKRADLLLEVCEKLRDRQVDFVMNIAGSGDYEEELKRQIRERGLGDRINFMGEIAHGQIPAFWERQDICISCSEWEGHSISHSEAMAAGAVPVLTDTSGAGDDVEEGVNGYVAAVGDVEALAEHIRHLHEHRELLCRMGNRSMEKIRTRNRKTESGEYWKALLE